MGAVALPCLRGRREQQRGNATRTEHRDRERLPGALLERTTLCSCLAECCPLGECAQCRRREFCWELPTWFNSGSNAQCAENWRQRPKVCRFALSYISLFRIGDCTISRYVGQRPRKGMPRGSSRGYPRGDPSGILPELFEGHHESAGGPAGSLIPKAT